jgi:hypothetical protein
LYQHPDHLLFLAIQRREELVRSVSRIAPDSWRRPRLMRWVRRR